MVEILLKKKTKKQDEKGSHSWSSHWEITHRMLSMFFPRHAHLQGWIIYVYVCVWSAGFHLIYHNHFLIVLSNTIILNSILFDSYRVLHHTTAG